MASSSGTKPARRPENVEGSFFVDETCIDCGTCMWMQPNVFKPVGAQSAVTAQPQTRAERVGSLRALLSCPTFSIHVTERSAEELKEALEGFPLRVPGTSSVFHLGFHDRASFGATPYLITRPQGNILVDSPRFNPKTLEAIKAAGGVKYYFFTHQDDVGDHDRWAEALGNPTRIIHAADTRQRTESVEVKLQGDGPWLLPDGSDDVELIFTPGHTRGCVSLLYRPDRALFTGDHLAWSISREGLNVFRDACWYSMPIQLESVRKLAGLPFVHVLPGHGAPASFSSVEAKDAGIERLLAEEASMAKVTSWP